MKHSVVDRLVSMRRWPLIGRVAQYALILLGADIPPDVMIGRDFRLQHWGFGVVIHNRTTIGDRVMVYNGVTIGRADPHRPPASSKFEAIIIEDDVLLSVGCKVLCKEGVLRVGRGTIVGANAVLLQSTGEWEIWVGIPARCIGRREDRGPMAGERK